MESCENSFHSHNKRKTGPGGISVLAEPVSDGSGKLVNRRIPNGTYGGVRGTNLQINVNFSLLDVCQAWHIARW